MRDDLCETLRMAAPPPDPTSRSPLEMNGWRINRGKLRSLRETARLSQTEMARRCGYHVRHYARFESESPSAVGGQPSPVAVHTFAQVLSEALHRSVRVEHICDRVPARRGPLRKGRAA